MFNMLRRGPPRFIAASAVLLTVLLCIYYVSFSAAPGLEVLTEAKRDALRQETNEVQEMPQEPRLRQEPPQTPEPEAYSVVSSETCGLTYMAETDVDTVEQFQKFDFQPYWMKSREYWDSNFEDRYKSRKSEWAKIPLKVILVPHSHNDPGWLKTYESYYHFQTRNILNHMANKLTLLKNMTFIWSEVSFLARWWESAHPTKKQMVQKLLQEGRLEITTGGWVMTDEATSHVYAMVDQLIEGHQWVRNNLGITPSSGWSIDPFGHGSTVPYLLKASGFSSGAVIQRIHYAWKQWLAEKQMGDFLWRQNWDGDGHSDILVHNQPFDIYSIKHSCGPHPQVCLNFDFRKISGEYTEFSLTAVPIDNENVKQKAELLLEQYGRTGSLFPHNVVLMPIGDDFRYDHDIEWDQQYRNYKKIIEYINQHKEYNAEISFGTPKDYFLAVKERMRDFKTIRGDFFVYSDIFSEGRPAYWSGYFTTRPYWKILDRELEANLRSAEILYTFALNYARHQGFNSTLKVLERDYEKLTRARQNLALFQHHDAITGTSKSFVMHDYALKMYEGIQESVFVQGYSAQTLLTMKESAGQLQVPPSARLIVPDTDRESYEKLPRKIPLLIKKGEFKKIVLFNSLAQHRQDIVKLHILSPKVNVVDSDGNPVLYQINPVWNMTNKLARNKRQDDSSENNMRLSKTQFELMFVADLPPLSLTTYIIEYSTEKNFEFRSVIYCQLCKKHTEFDVKPMQVGDIQLENHALKLLLDGRSGFLKAITKKSTNQTTQAAISFAAYMSAQFHSGAYLFKPDPNLQETEKEILDDYPGQKIIITSGPVSSEITVIYGNFLAHSVRIYHKPGPLSQGVYIENLIDFEAPPKNRETELFMRVISDISNGDPPEFYSDLNGFQMQRRIKVKRIGIEGNYFPLTSMAYMEDAKHRLSLLVNHAQGAASWQTGWLEVMLDRRTLYDDSRGMGEGVVDNKRTLTKFWLLLENTHESNEYSKPSLLANYLSLGLLYPPNVFIFEPQSTDDTGKTKLNFHSKVGLLSKPLPCDVHLMNFRTLADPAFTQFPSESALLLLHRQGFACSVATDVSIPKCGVQLSSSAFYPRTFFTGLKTKSIVQTSLTGLHKISNVKSFDNISVQAMDIVTVNVTFSH
ncbi:alpha-mannosidase 2 [Macrosteles quadrilineatus]|uniref:alpha-mannosidase 2 n=1 Tax=Macrosteles quadrilineatus TaxID=74068 RepID=UPI0023E2666D|nr:alpha-mannosidase 2 [Macrosteles quadrilineatus]XP_054270571.1 alpha-mannosidase 2 [Macrosteles quadrilineatus]